MIQYFNVVTSNNLVLLLQNLSSSKEVNVIETLVIHALIISASPIDSQSKRWTDFKRAIRWSDYPLGYSPEFRRHYSSYEQRPYYNDLPI
ncbi:hypothetical protein EWB00_010215 [Schistosoma japonicum]|uniref:Uncharacterized protein n=1 Tax=Schistosoma japonicum TaxID=6182 RepID=A0A4Z2DPF6_SCHJA|nr:hypothetical protein EWB00_010215 [Schistosoma japonicum]